MNTGKQTKGTCAFCGQEIPKRAAARHFASCEKLAARIAKADAGKTKPDTILRLRLQPAGTTPFWLDLEMRGTAALKELDFYLRAIWLECCGHLSHFASAAGTARNFR